MALQFFDQIWNFILTFLTVPSYALFILLGLCLVFLVALGIDFVLAFAIATLPLVIMLTQGDSIYGVGWVIVMAYGFLVAIGLWRLLRQG